jgi:hypothetical protein
MQAMKQVVGRRLNWRWSKLGASRDIAAQLDDKLQGTKLEDGKGWAYKPECWQDVAKFAAYRCQIRSLRLLPWQIPPCASDGVGDEPHDVLLRRMLEARLSRFDPDPAAALAAAAHA